MRSLDRILASLWKNNIAQCNQCAHLGAKVDGQAMLCLAKRS